MKVYLRLFLVSLILFIGLALMNEQSEDVITQNHIPGEIENVQFQPGLLPVSSSFPPNPSLFSISREHNSTFTGNQKHSGNFVSDGNENRFFSLKLDFSNRKPEMISKTGRLLHIYTGPEDPLLL
jgi:hypothetical protein